MIDYLVAQSFRVGAYISVTGLVVAGAWVASRAAVAAPEPVCKVKTSKDVGVSEVLDGGALKLSDGRRVLLSGIDVPREKGKGGPSPFAAEARAGVVAILKGRKVTLSETGAPSKSGWVRAHVFAGGTEWVQGAMISDGLARVRTFPDGRDCARELLSRERTARTAKRGLWSTPDFAIRTPDTAPSIEGRYGLVEGRVTTVADIGGRVFLNFGPDFRTDFTVHVKPTSVKLFADAGVSLESLEGKRVRVRGYISDRNGPQIDAAIPEQLEVLP